LEDRKRTDQAACWAERCCYVATTDDPAAAAADDDDDDLEVISLT